MVVKTGTYNLEKISDLQKWLDDNSAITDGKLSSGIVRKLKNNKEILNAFKSILCLDTDDPTELIYNALNTDCNKVCKVCGKPTEFFKYFYGYKDTCSAECKRIYVKERMEATKLEKYGNKNFVNVEKRLDTLNSEKVNLIDKSLLSPNIKKFITLLDNQRIYYSLSNKKGNYIVRCFSKSFSEDMLNIDFYGAMSHALYGKFKINLDTYIDDYIESLPSRVPHNDYPKSEIRVAWNSLVNSDSSLNHVPLKIVNSFHHSIYKARVGSKLSIEEAWQDKELLKRAIINRLIYSSTLTPNDVVKGLYISKITSKVSVFNPSMAKYLANKYLDEFDTVFDPFSGFSGRMLGVCSLGKRYIGQDINPIHTQESNDIIDFLGLDASVVQKDVFESNGEYECLFTCSPYNLKETWNNKGQANLSCDEWIDECLDRFKCRSYLFVVDSTEKYKDYIVDTIENKSHYGNNNEYVILIKR